MVGARQSAQLVPRVIHRLWIGGPEPEWLRGFAATWERPGWTLRRWGKSDLAELFPLRNQWVYDEAERLAPNHVGQLRSDVLRFEILHRFGGVWVDTDFECLRSFDELTAGLACFAAWEAEGRWIAGGFMGAVAAHPFIDQLIDGLEASVRSHPGERPARTTGPQYITRTYRAAGGQIAILPERLFYPFGWAEVGEIQPGTFDPAERWPGAVAVHWWANMRRERGLSLV